MTYGLLSVPCALFLLSVDVLGLNSTQMSKPMHWTYILRTCIGVYPAQITNLYSAQMSRPVSCAVYIVRRCLGLYYAQMSRFILCVGV